MENEYIRYLVRTDEFNLSRKRKKERKKNQEEFRFLFVYVVECILFLSLSLATYIPREHAFHHQSVHGLGSDDDETRRIYSVFSTEAPSIPSNTPVYTLLNGDQPMKLVHVDRHLRSPRAQCGFVVSTRTFIPIIQISGDLSLDDRSSLVSRTKSVQFSRVCYSPFFCTSGVHLIQFCVFSDFGIGNVQCCVFR